MLLIILRRSERKFYEKGNGTTKDQRTPEKVLEDVASVSLGGGHSAAITKGGDLYC